MLYYGRPTAPCSKIAGLSFPCRRTLAPLPPARRALFSCQAIKDSDRASSSLQDSEEQFLEKISKLGFPSGILPGGGQAREQVEALVPLLEASSPVAEPLGGSGPPSPLLFGRWRLVYASNGTVVTRTTAAQALVAASAVPGVGLCDVQQELEEAAEGRINTNNSAVFGLGPLGEWEAAIYGTWTPKTSTTASVGFEGYSVQLVGAFGWRPLQQQFLKLRIPLPEAARQRTAEFRTTYLSEHLRIARGSTGNLFVFVRQPEA